MFFCPTFIYFANLRYDIFDHSCTSARGDYASSCTSVSSLSASGFNLDRHTCLTMFKRLTSDVLDISDRSQRDSSGYYWA